MSGPGHGHTGHGFPGYPPAMRGYQSPSMQPPPQMAGMMPSAGGMVGMGSQMDQSYPNNMQNMSGITNQNMVVGMSAESPNQGMGGMGMNASMANVNTVGPLAGQNMNSMMGNANMGTNIGVQVSNMSTGTMTPNSAIQNTLNTGVLNTNPALTMNQNTEVANQGNQTVNQPQQSKEFNTASLCRFGQETVQDIVSRTQEVFQTLKAIQPPNGTLQSANSSNEKKAKIQEQLRTIRLLFKRLRLIYEKCNENCQIPGMEYTHIESLIPLKDEYEHKTLDERKTSETYKLVCEENKELVDQVVLKNKQLKEVITKLRLIIWEINVMLGMRRS